VAPLSVPSPGDLLVISDELGPYWTGRVEEPTVAFRPGGGKVSILARGMASSAGDQIVNTTIAWNPSTGLPYPYFPAGMACRDAFIAVILNICPNISFSAPDFHVGATLAGDSQPLWGRTGLECFNEIATLGSSYGPAATGGEQVYWHVYCDGALRPGSSTTSLLEAVYYGQVPAYEIAMAECDETEISWPMKYVANRVHVQWKDASGSGGIATATDPVSFSQLRIWKDHFIDGSSHVTTHYEAWLIANTVLARVKNIRAVGHQIRIKSPAMVTGLDGNPCPLWRVLAGRMIRITGLSATNPTCDAAGNTFFIRETEWDEYERTLTLITEEVETIASVVGRTLPAQLGALNTSNPSAARPALPRNDPPAAAGSPNSSTGGAFPASVKPGHLNEVDRGAAERDIVNPQIIANGFGSPIPTDKILGWLAISFAGYLTKVTMDATKAADPALVAAASATVEVWRADWNDGILDYDGRTVLHTLDTTTGFDEWSPTDPVELYRNSRLGFTYTAGDAEILVIPSVYTRDASLVDPGATPVTPTISNVALTPESAASGGVGFLAIWDTDVLSRGQISWGVSDVRENWKVQHTGLMKHHEVHIPAVAPGQEFLFEITATSQDGTDGTKAGTFHS